MEQTLKGELMKLERLQEFGIEYKLNLSSDWLKEAKTKVLKEFYRKNPLANDVSRGKDSYKTRLEPIEEKYSSFWKKIWIPEKDDLYNMEVERVIGSMNNVGVEFSNPHLFTTEGRKKNMWELDRISLGMGAVYGIILGLAVYCFPQSQEKVSSFMNDFINISPGLFFAGPYGAFKTIHNSNMKIQLAKLKDSSIKTDKFLREHYV